MWAALQCMLTVTLHGAHAAAYVGFNGDCLFDASTFVDNELRTGQPIGLVLWVSTGVGKLKDCTYDGPVGTWPLYAERYAELHMAPLPPATSGVYMQDADSAGCATCVQLLQLSPPPPPPPPPPSPPPPLPPPTTPPRLEPEIIRQAGSGEESNADRGPWGMSMTALLLIGAIVSAVGASTAIAYLCWRRRRAAMNEFLQKQHSRPRPPPHVTHMPPLPDLTRVPSGRHGSTPIMNALDEELASRTPTPDGRVRLPPMPTHSPTSPLQPLPSLYGDRGSGGGVDRAAREARGELRAMGGTAWGGGGGGGGGESSD
jgi:hypothetical protein